MFISSIGIMASHLASSVCMAAILAVDSATKLKNKSVKQLLGDFTFQLELLQMTDDIFVQLYELDPSQMLIFSDQALL
jgi:hypothetical protein